jgi:hypothetical protein
MVETIEPAVRRPWRQFDQGTWRRALGSYIAGSIVGGAATGAAIGALGETLKAAPVFRDALAASFPLIALLAILRDVIAPATRLPALQRQVPERWRWVLPLPVAMFLYGFQLGLGWATFVYYASYFVLLLFLLLSGNVLYAMVLHALYGLARASFLVPAVPAVRRGDVLPYLERLGALRGGIGWANAAVVAILAGLLFMLGLPFAEA